MPDSLPRFQDAVERARAAESRDGEVFTLRLICASTPLALRVQLVAAVADRLPARRIECTTRTVDELLAGQPGPAHGLALVCEWPDLDQRLGLRTAGGWGGQAAADAVASAEAGLTLLADRLLEEAQHSRVARISTGARCRGASLATLTLVMLVEERFGVRSPTDEIPLLLSFDAMASYLERACAAPG